MTSVQMATERVRRAQAELQEANRVLTEALRAEHQSRMAADLKLPFCVMVVPGPPHEMMRVVISRRTPSALFVRLPGYEHERQFRWHARSGRWFEHRRRSQCYLEGVPDELA